MIYLDNAATSLPKPPQVEKAMCAALNACGNPGRGGHGYAMEASRTMLRTRQGLRQYFGGSDSQRYIFTLSATDSINTAIQGMLRPKTHYVVTALEHNAVLRCVEAMKTRFNAEYTLVECRPDGYIHPRDILTAIRRDTALVVVNHASNVTGAIQDIDSIAKLCQNEGVPLLVDAAQSAAVVPISIDSIPLTMLALPAHKGLLGPQGCGVLYIREGCDPCPLRVGGTGSYSAILSQPWDMPDRYESGTPATPAIAGLGAGLEYLAANGSEIRAREEELTRALWEGLQAIPGMTLYGPPPTSPRLGVITFNLNDFDAGYVADRLWDEYQIATRAGLHCAALAHRHMGTLKRGAVRLSIGAFTTLGEAEAAIRAVYQIARES